MHVRTLIVAAAIGALAAAGCATPGPARPRVLPPRLAAWPGDQIAAAARSQLGAPYLNGGTTPAGFDCSGFVWFVFRQLGVEVPRDVQGQFAASQPVAAGQQRPGDLLFFAIAGNGPSHVAIALGGDAFVHAPSSRGVVRVEHLAVPYWSTRFIGARRVDRPAGAEARGPDYPTLTAADVHSFF